MAINVSAEKLLEAGAHFGHQRRRWNPKMEPFMHDTVDGVFVFDLIQTRDRLEEALRYLQKVKLEGKKILLVATKKQIKDKVKSLAEKTGIFYVDERWLGGTLTNFKQIRKSIEKLSALEEELRNAKALGYTKKERLDLSRDIEKLKRKFGGILQMEETPDVMVVVDTHRESSAVKEANMLEIPIVGIVDSNAEPDPIDYVIPMNDDATAALEYFMDLLEVALTAKVSSSSSKATKKRKTKKSKK